jgi:hypothetical protein
VFGFDATDMSKPPIHVPGSPFPTGGIGTGPGLESANRITVVRRANDPIVYASNGASHDITGVLYLGGADGKFFSLPATPLDGALGDISLAPSSDGKFLYGYPNFDI